MVSKWMTGDRITLCSYSVYRYAEIRALLPKNAESTAVCEKFTQPHNE